MMVYTKSVRQRIRSYLLDEGFKVGDISGVSDGDKIPLIWDLDDPHFMRKAEKGGYFSKSEDDLGFTSFSAFAFSDNAPSGKNGEYPSHLEDVLEALKDSKDSIYSISESDRRRYADDGADIIASAIMREIDNRISKNPEARDAGVILYVTPSSSNHAAEIAESLKAKIEGHLSRRTTRRKRDNEIENFRMMEGIYKQFGERLQKYVDPVKNKRFAEFFNLFKKKQYKAAYMRVEEISNSMVNASLPPEGKRLYDNIRVLVEKTKRELGKVVDAKFVDPTVGITSGAFSKISVEQDPIVELDPSLLNTARREMVKLGGQETDGGDIVIDKSQVSPKALEAAPKYMRQFIDGHPMQLVSLSDFSSFYESRLRKHLPAWRKRMIAKGKKSFSISSVPAAQRRHVTGFLNLDAEQLQQGSNFAIIVDDNIESGVTMREMRRAFDRIRDLSNPPVDIFGAPLLMIRGLTSKAEGQTYSGRRGGAGGSKISDDVEKSAALENIDPESDLYKKVMLRLNALAGKSGSSKD